MNGEDAASAAPANLPGDDEPWEPGDGTRWLYFPQFREWHGWMPGEDGLWVRDEDEFRRMYPDAPSRP